MHRNYRQKKTERDRQTKRRFLLVLIVCLVATLAYLRSRLWVIDLSYDYAKLQRQHATIKKENARLRVEVGRLKSPQRIEKIAREKLGLKNREELERRPPVVLMEP